MLALGRHTFGGLGLRIRSGFTPARGGKMKLSAVLIEELAQVYAIAQRVPSDDLVSQLSHGASMKRSKILTIFEEEWKGKERNSVRLEDVLVLSGNGSGSDQTGQPRIVFVRRAISPHSLGTLPDTTGRRATPKPACTHREHNADIALPESIFL
jgi:hypothetical protein